ncbi:MAG: hypothetical protein OJF50_000167 [Nitrospira sp.]|jgi:hypothetical protein|nr:hypothetical protein [Nitrospira sp.]
MKVNIAKRLSLVTISILFCSVKSVDPRVQTGQYDH